MRGQVTSARCDKGPDNLVTQKMLTNCTLVEEAPRRPRAQSAPQQAEIQQGDRHSVDSDANGGP